MIGQQQLLGLLLEEVHEQHMIGEGRKVLDGIAANISRLRIIERRDGM